MDNTKKTRHFNRPKFIDEDERLLDFMWKIFQWNPEWLDDPKYEKEPPPIFEEERSVISTSLFYENFEDYYRAMEPLMLLEFFHILKRDANDDFSDHKEKKTKNISGQIHGCHGTVINKSKNEQQKYKRVQRFILETEVLKSIEGTFPIRGELVRLKYNNDQEILGYIEDLSRIILSSSSSTGVRCCQVSTCSGCLLKLIFQIRTKDVAIPNSYKSTMHLTTVTSMGQYLRLIRALEDLPGSQLFKSILKPNCEDYLMSEANVSTILPLITNQNLNKTQLEIIAGVVETIKKKEKKICLVQGPPGCGKTTTIVNIIANVLKDPTAKILLCAPANKAVDDIVLRLLKCNDCFKKNGINLNIVRIGRDEAIDPGVKDLSFANLSFIAQMESINITKTLQYEKEESILDNANIIASTLSSCYSYKMESKYGIDRAQSIPVCIVDEAGQATELGTLIPLMLGVETLVLVGDPQQLPPTIISQESRERGLDVSLFARAQKNFANDPWNPIIMLNTQYRMVEPIARWPNKYFYSGKLKTESKVLPLPFCHYKVLNHNCFQTQSRHGNEGEAKLIINLLVGMIEEFISRNNNIPSIGIITPYHHQRKIIIEYINKLLRAGKQRIQKKPNGIIDKKKTDKDDDEKEEEEELLNPLHRALKTVQINTVDGFQGQESDIILMSCVRSHGIGFISDPNRLNVSLTRAKHTMILLGNFTTFKKNVMWKNLLDDAETRECLINIDDPNLSSVSLRNIVIEDR
ncbi:helicase sen1-like [Aphidius gifuensis]|uniref:helicase sen1-like n=1 Tax=Aphidius gifuensis TaxID=684658 RepID=UPI001CDB5607|nr:helicase sen1-like [Aphidius gifuensis]